MQKILHQSVGPVLVLALAFVLVATGYSQNTAKSINIPAGQEMIVEGVILNQQTDTLTVRTFGNATYLVAFTDATELKERKSNPFRGAKRYSKIDLVPGLQVAIKGAGTSSGALAAKEIRFKNNDFIVAQAMDTRVVPVEKILRDTQARLGDTEQNAQRLSGQVQELSVVSNAARGGAKAAQETADNALTSASTAQSAADKAKAGVRAANERITLLDDFAVKDAATVYFNAGSAVLSKENRSELEKLAEQTKAEKGFVIEVAGFASADGEATVNRRLSQKRADAVIQYLAENYRIPLRRFVTPMGYGESQPVADNKTHSGRKENRRVEVRMLISKGLTAPVETAESMKVETSQVR